MFYGWYIVAVAVVVNATAGIGLYTFGVFINPMSEDLGWSRTAMSLVVTARLALGIFLPPIVGPLVDRKHGARLLILGGGGILGTSMMLTGGVTHLWQFYVVAGAGYGVASLALHPQVVIGPLISKWFIRQRGRAQAIASMGNNLGAIVFIPLATIIIVNFGWREAWIALGIIGLLLVAPLGMLFIRRTPEDIGLMPDGAPGRESPKLSVVKRANQLATDHDWTLREATRTSALWIMVIAFTIASGVFSAFLIHLIPYLSDKGYSVGFAAAVVILLNAVVMVVKPVWGFLGDRIHVRYLMGTCLALSGLGMLVLVFVSGGPLIWIFVLTYGSTVAGFVPLRNVMWANYFGRAHLGAITGTLLPITQIVSAISPVIAAFVFDVTLSFDPAFFAFGVLFAVCGVVIFLTRPPTPVEETLQ